jgi:uncharacterized protein YbbK (DUF523 family)
MGRMGSLRQRLSDGRKGKVVFLSHCILNVNARYLGGSERAGSVEELIRGYLESGTGMIQLPCPEQAAWGGVLKPWLWLGIGMGENFLSRIALGFFIAWTKARYRSYARRAAKKIAEYVLAGYAVRGVVCIDGSPSCGLNTRMSMARSFSLFARTRVEDLDRRKMNAGLYGECMEEGRGYFTAALARRLDRLGISVDFSAYDLAAEIEGGMGK